VRSAASGKYRGGGETQYVSVGDADVAYQVLGDGPPDLLFFNGQGSHLELAWQVPDQSEFFTKMTSLGRLILFDRCGTGMSDGVPRDAIATQLIQLRRAATPGALL
jgi:hypothetical protein